VRILVVDDSTIMRRIITKTLASAGFTDIVEAENGAEALGCLYDVNLILTDWNMPVMDGMSFVKEVRSSPVFSDIPIVMITAEGAQKEVVKALKQGVNDYIVIPFATKVLIEKVKSILEM
jgi:two-component system chemotaxis response regulator CheY